MTDQRPEATDSDSAVDWYEAGRQAANQQQSRTLPASAGLHPRSQDAREFFRGFDSVPSETSGSEPEPEPTEPAAGPVRPGESTDPDVHYLIANRRAHELTLADPSSDEPNREHARGAIEGIDRDLWERGYR